MLSVTAGFGGAVIDNDSSPSLAPASLAARTGISYVPIGVSAVQVTSPSEALLTPAGRVARRRRNDTGAGLRVTIPQGSL